MKTTTPPKSYDGEHVYVGIDVHKKTYVVVARVKQTIVKRWTTAAKPEAFAAQLLKYFKGGIIHSAYEAGFSGFVLHRVLEQAGIKSIVVHAAAIEVAVHKRVKTDKRDAAKIAEQLEAKRLDAIHVPSKEQEHNRLLSRTRQQLVQERAAVKQKIRMKAHQFGLIAPDERREMSPRLSKNSWRWLPVQPLPSSSKPIGKFGKLSILRLHPWSPNSNSKPRKMLMNLSINPFLA